MASAILAPSLRHVADSLALHWRRQLTAVTHKRYLKRINFYTVSNLAGMQVRRPKTPTKLDLIDVHQSTPADIEEVWREKGWKQCGTVSCI